VEQESRKNLTQGDNPESTGPDRPLNPKGIPSDSGEPIAHRPSADQDTYGLASETDGSTEPNSVSPQPQTAAKPTEPVSPAKSKSIAQSAEAASPDDTGIAEWTKYGQFAAPYWLASAVFHLVLLIVLALMFLPVQQDDGITLTTEIFAEKEGQQLEVEAPLMGDQSADEVILTPETLPEVLDPFAEPSASKFDLLEEMTARETVRSQIGLALAGREEGSRKALLGAYGGTATTESAVQLGLKWLARNQLRSGAWSLSGPYTGGALQDSPSAATSMALLAFLGNGHTHQSGTQYSSVVKLGINQLLKMQDVDGCFFTSGGHSHRFYAHAQATIVVCELLAMSKDSSLRDPAQRAVKYLLDTQDPELGGWRYSPRAGSDLSVTGWVVMALQSARMAGIEIPSPQLILIEKFLDSASREDGARYSYLSAGSPRLSMSAEGLLCRQYLGWAQKDKRMVRGTERLVFPENLINYRNPDVYYWYYAAQVTHHMGGEIWKKWNTVMRQAVPENQVKKGREAGSWSPSGDSSFDMAGGRLYVTCLSIYMLEVYYRHLPIYESVYNLPIE
jgi:hypothetical protein